MTEKKVEKDIFNTMYPFGFLGKSIKDGDRQTESVPFSLD